jgi:type II secretory pathway pseudopilin PulG
MKMQYEVRSAKCEVNSFQIRIRNAAPKLRTPHSLLRTSRGFAYVALIVAIVIIGLSLGAAGKYWSYEILRDKEEELLFRGDQYRIAIERYYFALPGRPQYPASVENLLNDARTPAGKRHLRQQFKDPITDEDFVLIQDQLDKRIRGVHSASNKTPLKLGNFPEVYKEVAGKDKYSDWEFKTTIKPGAGPAGGPGALPRRRYITPYPQQP